MDTVQNISNIILDGATIGSDPRHSNPHLPLSHANILHPTAHGNNGNLSDAVIAGNTNSTPLGPQHTNASVNVAVSSVDSAMRRSGERREFLSRPNWLFTHNENVLFCSALQCLRFPDHNHVPRKFIEEWFQEHMVSVDTKWPAGQRYIDEAIKESEKNPERARDRMLKELNTRRRNIAKHNKADLMAAQQRYRNADTLEAKEQALKDMQEAQKKASIPVSEIIANEPNIEEVALVELSIKIMRRLQGQTDRMHMAEDLVGEQFTDDHNGYFAGLLAGVQKAILEKHAEIALEREKVETKSKQSRKRRRLQVSSGATLSGSATRVRFTNREMAMLIHWIYTYPKSDWTHRIYEYYLTPETARSAEHVRDKMRDLITRSREVDKGGLTSMKTRAAGGFIAKPNESVEVQELVQNDLTNFKYPDGPLEQTPNGRYFDEERSVWLDGPLPVGYATRYQEEVSRILQVVRAKVGRSSKVEPLAMGTPHPHVGSFSPQNDQEQQFRQQRMQHQLQQQQQQQYQQQQLQQHQELQRLQLHQHQQLIRHHQQQQQQQQHHHLQSGQPSDTKQHISSTVEPSMFDEAFVNTTGMMLQHPSSHHQSDAPNFAADDDFNLVSIWNENHKQGEQDETAAMAAAALQKDYFLEAIEDKEIKRARH